MTHHSEALVPTDRPERYASQLVKHFGNKIETEWENNTGLLKFPFGDAHLYAEDGVLRMHASAEDEEFLTRLQEVVGSHLIRFGQRDELTVEWKEVQG